jgi:hypothetical protein
MENTPIPPTNSPELKRREQNNGAGWALILILVGVIFLVQNLHIASFTFHWWALFIFIPVIGSLSAAWNGFRRDGRITTKVSGSLGSAVLIGTVGTILLLGLDWAFWWPLVVMAVGLSMLLTGVGKLERLNSQTLSVLTRLSAWIGLGAILLGFGFLVNSLPISSLHPYLVGYKWWAIPILIPGLGAFISVVQLYIENQNQMNWAAWSMLLVAVFIVAIGLLALFALDWNLLFPVVLIACGLVILVGFFNKK